jgi:D-alanyl-D-alanine endopeptidase (penicillin-binding protein 7)
MAIASITKLMTAMVIIDANLDMDEPITIVKADRDTIRYSKTRLPIGSTLTREDMLLMALVASENRAAFALARTYPGGTKEFIKAMNDKARYLGLRNTKFADAAGLRKENVSTAQELVKMVRVAAQYTLIREFTTIVKDVIIDDRTGKTIRIWNTNRLMRKADWEIYLSKTGFTSDAGNCLVMKVKMGDRPLIIVLLNSWGKLSKYGDSNRIKHWIRNAEAKVRKLNLI